MNVLIVKWGERIGKMYDYPYNDILNSWSDENKPNYYKTVPLFKRFLKAAKEKL